MKDFIKKYLKWLILFLCLIGFLALAEDVFNKEIMQGDILGYELVSKFLIGETATPVAKVITELGGAIFLITLTILLVLCIKDKRIGISICANLAIITLLNQILKRILQRPRPTEFRIIEETGYSFPSGHSMVGMAFYGYLIYLSYKYIKNKYIKWGLTVLLGLLIGTIGISRIYLGVHYTSDVIGGFLISVSYLIIYIMAVNKLMMKGNEKKTALRKKRELKVKTKKIANSFKYAWQGIISAFKTERNMKIHAIIMCLVIFAGIIFKLNVYEWIICIICFMAVIGGELINTSIETTVDIAMPEKNEKAKLAKDVAAGAVLILAIGAAIIGLIIFIPKYTGTINSENTAKSITLKLDSSSKITLTGDSYITALETSNTSYSNINFNGYKLYVNGVAIN